MTTHGAGSPNVDSAPEQYRRRIDWAHNPDGRTYGIDCLRGVACASVIAFHFVSRAPRAGWMTDAPLRGFEAVARYGYLGVHLFFMVSGYVIFLSAAGRSPRAFVASRVARLCPAMWVAATITLLLTHWWGDSRFTVRLSEYLLNLPLMAQFVGARFVDGAYWSLAVELQFYIFVWLTLRGGLMPHVEWLLAAWLLLSVADGFRLIYPLELFLIAQWAPLFVVGATTYLVSAQGWTRVRLALLTTSGVLALWHGSLEARRLGIEWSVVGPDPSIVCALLTVSGVLILLIGTGRISMRKSRWATIPGMLTYPVYLIHQFAGYVIYASVSRATGSRVFALTCAIMFAVVLGIGLHYGVERPLAPRLRRLIGGESEVGG